MKTLTSDSILNDNQVTEILGVTPRVLRLWRLRRGLPFIRLTSKVIRYRKSDLDAWVDRHSVTVRA